MARIFLIFAVMTWGLTAQAGESHHTHGSKYSGQEARSVKSLSEADVAELKRGGGWGLAKAAELNGVPGPAHLLELRHKIPLNAAQIAKITNLFDDMKLDAIAQGEKLILLEQTLEQHFRNRTITDQILRDSLNAIAETREELRYIHLSTHLKTPRILSSEQIKKYNDLRGYHASH